eukprot:12339503-Karenia_brevis.AAC.1
MPPHSQLRHVHTYRGAELSRAQARSASCCCQAPARVSSSGRGIGLRSARGHSRAKPVGLTPTGSRMIPPRGVGSRCPVAQPPAVPRT